MQTVMNLAKTKSAGGAEQGVRRGVPPRLQSRQGTDRSTEGDETTRKGGTTNSNDVSLGLPAHLPERFFWGSDSAVSRVWCSQAEEATENINRDMMNAQEMLALFEAQIADAERALETVSRATLDNAGLNIVT
jgi:hypothetical protein